jgi:hypothetical protein
MARTLGGYYPTRLTRARFGSLLRVPSSSAFVLSGPGPPGRAARAANFNHDRGKCKLETGAAGHDRPPGATEIMPVIPSLHGGGRRHWHSQAI